MKELILLAGIPASGKTTLSWKLAPLFNIKEVHCTDNVYQAIGDHLSLKNFPNPNVWKSEKQDKVVKLKEDFYKKMLPLNDRVFLEGYGLMFVEDRAIIEDIYKGYNLTYLYKHVEYSEWLNQKGVLDCEKRKGEYDYLIQIASINNKSIKIL